MVVRYEFYYAEGLGDDGIRAEDVVVCFVTCGQRSSWDAADAGVGPYACGADLSFREDFLGFERYDQFSRPFWRLISVASRYVVVYAPPIAVCFLVVFDVVDGNLVRRDRPVHVSCVLT